MDDLDRAAEDLGAELGEAIAAIMASAATVMQHQDATRVNDETPPPEV